MFVVIEGLDGTGKTTLAAALVDHLASERPLAIRFPDRSTPTGKIIDAHLRGKGVKISDQEIHRLMSANRWERAADIQAAIRDDIPVICDRYSYSGAAYSMAKGLKLAWCRMADQGLPEPDLVLFLDMDDPRMLGTEIYEKVEFQERVRAAYKRIRDDRWVTLDGSQSRDAVLAAALAAMNRL